ncbi:flavin reductase [Nocardioides albidus]|uniref:Flavin reductase n=2 Tax=Nocardioides albidus TaxID=1517589 RepID=A0A5C4W3B1_9ACTN|nr:flavin reductase [Nocardioides albidus]TNM41925.1 flavin reductase [Nocardioides albidus]
MSDRTQGGTRIEARHFREVLGQYPTGVVVVTAPDTAGEPVGMTVGSFTSVSLDPPLVAFLPSKTSSSWAALRATGDRFCINVLRADQEDLCRAVAMRKSDKFAGFEWHRSPAGNPVLEDAVVWIDCVTDRIHDGGDHDIVVGRVVDLDFGSSGDPLLFFRGGYGSFRPSSLVSGDSDLLSHLGLIDLARPQMESLAADLDTEVTAIALVGDEMILAAAAGHTDIAVSPTRVGQRLPFMAPIGSCFAAWGDDELCERWIARVADGMDAAELAALRGVPELVRQRGYAIAVGHREGAHLESVATRINAGDPGTSPDDLRKAFFSALPGYNRPEDPDGDVELRSLSAPVFGPDGRIAYMLTLWGRPGLTSPADIRQRAQALVQAAAAASRVVADVA